MNIYEVLHIENGMIRTVRLVGSDISQVIYYVNVSTIVEVRLVGTVDVEDRT